MKILIIGAGCTGSALAHIIKKCSSREIALTIWEKSAGCGGRMATSRFPADSLGESCSLDIGAQYISNVEKYQQAHADFYEDLKSSSVLTRMTGEVEGALPDASPTQHYISSKGLSAIAKHFVAQSGAELCVKTRLDSIRLDSNGLMATANTGNSALFDYVILTIPAPQILALSGIDSLLDSTEKSLLEGVSYSSRFALAVKLPAGFTPPVSWTGLYVTDNPCVRFICIDSKKRGLATSSTLLVHTGVPYALKNLERDKEDAGLIEDIFTHVQQVLPWLPTESKVLRCHKWRYSQVHHAIHGEPGYFNPKSTSNLLLCGDGFTHSNLDGCISSALKTWTYLESSLQGSTRQ
ncbi:renalase-like [Watersipora subatra]|uniref:renalase-like n=1 Tax=Watersipora subatra TaxID=2589382 RepID=UPI00355B3C60